MCQKRRGWWCGLVFVVVMVDFRGFGGLAWMLEGGGEWGILGEPKRKFKAWFDVCVFFFFLFLCFPSLFLALVTHEWKWRPKREKGRGESHSHHFPLSLLPIFNSSPPSLAHILMSYTNIRHPYSAFTSLSYSLLSFFSFFSLSLGLPKERFSFLVYFSLLLLLLSPLHDNSHTYHLIHTKYHSHILQWKKKKQTDIQTNTDREMTNTRTHL